VAKCGMSVFEWEPPGANGKRGEFLMGPDRSKPAPPGERIITGTAKALPPSSDGTNGTIGT